MVNFMFCVFHYKEGGGGEEEEGEEEGEGEGERGEGEKERIIARAGRLSPGWGPSGDVRVTQGWSESLHEAIGG